MKNLRHALPPMNALLVFEAAARHQNLTLAAEELCIAASAVSRHVGNLERRIGFTVFKRTGNRLELTPEGRRLAEAVSAGLGHVRDVTAVLRQEVGRRAVTIGCSYDVGHLWLMSRYRALAESVPDYQLRVITSDSYTNFDNADVDVSVRYGKGNWPGFASVRLFDEEIFPICAPELIEAHPELLGATPDVIMRFPLLQLTTDDTLGVSWTEWLRAQGALLPTVRSQLFPNYSLLLVEAMAGGGIAFGYTNLVDQLLADRRIVQLSDRIFHSGSGFYAVFRKSAPDAVTTIVNLLRTRE